MPEYHSRTGYNPVTRTVEDTIVSTDGRQVHVRTTQDCEPVIDAVKMARELPRHRNMRHVGSVPLTLYYKWMQEAGIKPGEANTTRKMEEVLRRKLADIEYQKLVVRGF